MKHDSINQEQVLLSELKSGSKVAFEQLYHLHKERMARNLLRMLKSYELVEEILQDLFIKIWDNREKIDPEKSFASYLYQVGTNLVRDFFRKVARDQKLMEELWTRIEEQEFPDTLIQQVKADEELMRTIDLLSPQRKLVFHLCKLEGKSYAEVAKLLQISEAAVNDHITKANRFIRENYNKSELLFIGIILSALLEGM